jgi:hypothetical protein
MTLLENLKEIRNLLIPPFEISYVEKSYAWVEEQLSILPNWNKGVYRLPLDGRFFVTTKEQFDKIIAWDRTNLRPWRDSVFDCENHTFSFAENCAKFFGVNQVARVIDYSAAHSYALILYPDRRPLLLEPQLDKLFEIEERDKNFYKLEQAYILI